MFKNKWMRLIIALLYFLFITYLFFLPGSAFPKNNWLSTIWFDKWVHIGLFAVLVVVLFWALNSTHHKQIVAVLIGAAIYGIVVEVVQDQFIPNRGMDVGDWVADMLGSGVGLFIWNRYKKNRPL